MLDSNEGDVDGWARDQMRIWSSFKDEVIMEAYMEAVQWLILKSFKDSLDEELQRLLFLDVALFIQPSHLQDSWSILGFMHGRDEAIVRKLVRRLKRLCFIEAIGETGREVDLELMEKRGTKRPVRAMILEIEAARKTIYLRNFSSLKSVVIKNCRSLVKVKIAGLTSLLILDIIDFDRTPLLESNDLDGYASVQNMKSLYLISYGDRHVGCNFSPAVPAYTGSSIINHLRMKLDKYVPSFMKQPGYDLGIAKHMTGLQVLCLWKTGIKCVCDMSSCWPLLRKLNIEEYCLEEFRLGALPALESFRFFDNEWPIQSMGRKIRLQGKDLLDGCPNLQELEIWSTSFNESFQLMKSTWRGMGTLKLLQLETGEEVPLQFSSAMQTLQALSLILCKNLERVHLSAGFLSLTHLEISACEKLERVDFDSAGLSNLAHLEITECEKLWREDLSAGLSSLTHLEIYRCESVVEVKLGLQAVPNLR
ncbi:hypothetical protein GOP47_0017604 [Adiantum capillus-veneris]|uniref:Uncharacterized protein n=1 Tax=Adiantum capillus-veneris TaxID=13818 RepID=A0A9D4ZBY1_ADICA|nr:hypothetical protein GOP47_0017604 [Adiantum capillus-veneris]